VSAPTAREALESLVDQGLVEVHRSMKSAAYRLNDEHVLAALVSSIFDREASVTEEFERDLSAALAVHSSVKEAILFGSAARGDMRPTSDIDVAIRSNTEIPEDAPRLEHVRRKYGNRVSLIRLRPRVGRGLRERIAVEGKALPMSRRKRA
jgi:predicted nucleotidyltransferase